MRGLFHWCLFSATIFGITSCASSSKIKDGETAYVYKKYSLSSEMLQKDFQKAKDIREKAVIALKIAESYDKQLQFAEAEAWYKKVADARVQEDAVLLYINALKRLEKYDQAFKSLDEYLKANKSEKFKFQKEYEFLQDIISKRKKPTNVRLVNLEINSASLDFAPFLKDNSLFFTSTRQLDKPADKNTDAWTGEGYSSVFTSSKVSTQKFGEVMPVDNVFNSPFHDAELILTRDGKTAYFTRCGSDQKNRNEFCHIYRCVRNIDDSWSNPERIQLFADTVNEGQAFLTPDENELYFVADAKGGYGGRDIYFAKKNISGDFSTPVNAGSKVNSKGDELFPVIAADNTLYFSSNGRTGFGGLDIYSASKESKIYSNVQNLGYGVNSGGDDFGIALLKSKDDSVLLTGYITSNRPGGKGKDDIYFFEKRMPPKDPLPPPVYLLKILVNTKNYQNENNPNSAFLGLKPVTDAVIEVNGKPDPVAAGIKIMNTDAEGLKKVFIPKGSSYNLKISKPGYLSQEEKAEAVIDGKSGDTVLIEKIITLNKIYKNVEIVLNNIYYDYDKWDIRKDAAQSLDSLVDILLKNPGIKIELTSHTDCRGSDAYNQTLSQKRAESVVAYLIENGIDAARLTAKGYGETVPVDNCECAKCTEEQYQRNRRTAFKILSE